MRTTTTKTMFPPAGAHQCRESSIVMERIMLCILYLAGWHIFPACLSRLYHFVAEPMDWMDAQAYCRKTYTDLATAENAEEMNQIVSTVSSFGEPSAVWIGLYSIIDWKWSDGYNGSGAEYRDWRQPTEPDFYYDNEFCVVTGQINDPWWDDACSIQYSPICYTGTLPKFKYVNQVRLNWSSAQKYCREKFVDLATVKNHNESVEIQGLLPNGWAWIGLYRDPNLYWSDGAAYSFTHWQRGTKVLGSANFTCVTADMRHLGRWLFFPCGSKLPFVCSTNPRKRREVKLRIKLEHSSVDPNDPAVKADILRKLQHRLKEQGVTGRVGLRWSEQPDGKVFHKEERREVKSTCPSHV